MSIYIQNIYLDGGLKNSENISITNLTDYVTGKDINEISGRLYNTIDVLNNLTISDLDNDMNYVVNSDLTNNYFDKNYITSNYYDNEYITSNYFDKNYITSNYFDKEYITSNYYDKEYITSNYYDKEYITSNYYDKEYITSNYFDKNYITSNYFDKEYITSNYYDKEVLDKKISKFITAEDLEPDPHTPQGRIVAYVDSINGYWDDDNVSQILGNLSALNKYEDDYAHFKTINSAMKYLQSFRLNSQAQIYISILPNKDKNLILYTKNNGVTLYHMDVTESYPLVLNCADSTKKVTLLCITNSGVEYTGTRAFIHIHSPVRLENLILSGNYTDDYGIHFCSKTEYAGNNNMGVYAKNTTLVDNCKFIDIPSETLRAIGGATADATMIRNCIFVKSDENPEYQTGVAINNETNGLYIYNNIISGYNIGINVKGSVQNRWHTTGNTNYVCINVGPTVVGTPTELYVSENGNIPGYLLPEDCSDWLIGYNGDNITNPRLGATYSTSEFSTPQIKGFLKNFNGIDFETYKRNFSETAPNNSATKVKCLINYTNVNNFMLYTKVMGMIKNVNKFINVHRAIAAVEGGKFFSTILFNYNVNNNSPINILNNYIIDEKYRYVFDDHTILSSYINNTIAKELDVQFYNIPGYYRTNLPEDEWIYINDFANIPYSLTQEENDYLASTTTVSSYAEINANLYQKFKTIANKLADRYFLPPVDTANYDVVNSIIR